MSGPASGLPARGYSWPPFEPGNTLRLRHGAWSPRVWSQRAAEILPELADEFPWLADAHPSELTRLASIEAKVETLDHALTDALERGDGFDLLIREWRATVRLALELRRELGLTPMSRARLERDRVQAVAQTVDIQMAVSAAQKSRAAQESRGA